MRGRPYGKESDAPPQSWIGLQKEMGNGRTMKLKKSGWTQHS